MKSWTQCHNKEKAAGVSESEDIELFAADNDMEESPDKSVSGLGEDSTHY